MTFVLAKNTQDDIAKALGVGNRSRYDHPLVQLPVHCLSIVRFFSILPARWILV